MNQLELLAASRKKKKHDHEWITMAQPLGSDLTGDYGVATSDYEVCNTCHLLKTDYEVRQRRARNNVKRGKHYEHGWAGRLGMRQTGGLNKEDDALNAMFVGQAKSMSSVRFPGWMSVELDKLRARWADRIPILGILEAAGQGNKGRRLIVVDEQDWIALHTSTKDLG